VSSYHPEPVVSRLCLPTAAHNLGPRGGIGCPSLRPPTSPASDTRRQSSERAESCTEVTSTPTYYTPESMKYK
jgi:hypothetical protein